MVYSITTVPKSGNEWKARFAIFPRHVGTKGNGKYITIWLRFYEVRDCSTEECPVGLEYRLPGSDNTVVFDDWRCGAW